MNNETKLRIEKLIHSSKVFLFMKGTPERPECGFSMKVVSILKENHIEFKSFNVLTDDSIREGIKEYSNWPTIPQLYIDGEFIGGCDITIELARTGELQKLV